MVSTSVSSVLAASLSYTVLGASTQTQPRAATVPTPSFFVPGVEWQIEIDTALDTEGTRPIVPTDAKVWDVNLYDETDKDTTENPPDENGIARLRVSCCAQRTSLKIETQLKRNYRQPKVRQSLSFATSTLVE